MLKKQNQEEKTMNFNENFEKYLSKLQKIKSQIPDLSEESTKTSLIMPFFSLLGYDVFDVSEFMPEFTCDVATKKGEKVDYAILKDGEPIVLIETKRAGMKLQKQQLGQLYRYFSTSRCRIAILTNGITYQFFSDLNAPNVMDEEPFLSFNMLEDDPSLYVSSIFQFCKDNFNIKDILSKAVFQKYSKVVQKTLKEDMINPSDEIVKYFLSRPEIKTGNRITSQMIEKHRKITAIAIQEILGISTEDETQPEKIKSTSNSNQKKIKNIVSRTSKSISESEEIISISDKEDKILQDSEIFNSESEKVRTVESISEKIRLIAQNNVSDYQCQEEDTPEFYKLHIYTTDNKKMGIIKISKSDLTIQFRALGNGGLTVYELQSTEEFKKLMEER